MTANAEAATPASDLATWQDQRALRRDGRLLTPDLIALAQNGSQVIIASRTADGRPVVGVAIGCRVTAEGAMRILLSRPANGGFVEAVAAGRPVAATFTGAPDHRAFQVKAERATVRSADPADRPEIDRQTAVLRDGLVQIGFSEDLAAGIVAFDPEDLVMIEFLPSRVFTQTPGPGAGAELVP